MNEISKRRRLWLPAGLALLAAVAMTAFAASTALGRATTHTIKIGILSDCEGAFGVFYEQDIGGALAAFAEFAGAKPKDPKKPSAGMTGGSIAGHKLEIVGFGCSNDRADKAISELRRLVEQLGAEIVIGPLSGDEAIAVANYAKTHPKVTIVNGTSGSMDPTMRVRAANFFRFNGDGAQWNAGLGDLAYSKSGWRKAAVIMDDYSFAWTSAAGMIAEFCAVGGEIVKRVFPPLNTTDYSSFVQQLPPPDQVDGYFWAVGGAGTLPALKAFEQAFGPIEGKQHMGNLFFATPGTFQELGNRMDGVYAGGSGTAGDLKTAKAKWYTGVIGKWFKAFPPLPGTAGSQASSLFVYNYFNNAWALIQGLKAVKGNLSDGHKGLRAALAKVVLDSGYGKISLDRNRQAIQDQYANLLYVGKDGKLAVKTVAFIPQVDQTFGGTFSEKLPMPGRTFPDCKKRSLPWAGKARPVVNGVVK